MDALIPLYVIFPPLVAAVSNITDDIGFFSAVTLPVLRTDIARTENHSPLRNWIPTLPPSERLLLRVKLRVVHPLLLIVKVAERRASFFFLGQSAASPPQQRR